jgi:hypothetical protein
VNPALAHPFYIALKSSLAALLALTGVELLGIPDRLSATFVAVVCISPTVYSGLRRGLDQLGASAPGGVVTWAAAQLLPRPAALTVALFVVVYVAFRVGLARGVLVASFTVLYVLLIPGPNPTLVLEYRLASVAVGVVSALAMNLAVSALSYRSVFRRRLVIARTSVADQWEQLAVALEQTQAQRDVLKVRALFEPTFPLLRHLYEELSDAVQESRLRGGKPRQRLENALEATHQLLAVAHYGKDLALRLERETAEFPNAAAWAKSLGASMRSGAALAGEVRGEEGLRGPLQSASEAWAHARAAEARAIN